MKRELLLSFFDFQNHIDLSSIDNMNIGLKLYNKGELTANDKTVIKKNCTDIFYTGEIVDDYNLRIQNMIDVLGGEKIISDLVSRYNSKSASIVLEIPARTSGNVEDGFISLQMMKKICSFNLDLQFIYK